jgi:hypothetical protein
MGKAIILMSHMKSKAEYVAEVETDENGNTFPNRQAAIDFINKHKVEPYIDEPNESDDYGNVHAYTKTFAKGSPLEWLNPISESEMQGNLGYHGHGIVEIEEQNVPRWVRVI